MDDNVQSDHEEAENQVEDPQPDQQRTNLIQLRGNIKRKITNFTKFVASQTRKSKNIEFSKLQTRLATIVPLLEEFHQIQREIEIITNNGEIDEMERNSLEDAYFDVVSDAKDLCRVFEERNVVQYGYSTSRSSSCSHSSSHNTQRSIHSHTHTSHQEIESADKNTNGVPSMVPEVQASTHSNSLSAPTNGVKTQSQTACSSGEQPPQTQTTPSMAPNVQAQASAIQNSKSIPISGTMTQINTECSIGEQLPYPQVLPSMATTTNAECMDAILSQNKHSPASHTNTYTMQYKQNETSSIHSMQLQEQNKSISTMTLQLNLPQVQLPTYDGSFENWLHFRDTFMSLVHDNSQLNDVNKLHYLKSSLRGQAAAAVQHLPNSASNYSIIWEYLKRRYENSKIIIDKHLNMLFNLKPVQYRNANSLRSFKDELINHVAALAKLEEPTRDTLIIHLASKSLDNDTRNRWEEQRVFMSTKGKTITLHDFTDYLETRCQVLDSNSSYTQPSTSKSNYIKHDKKMVTSAITFPKCSLCKDKTHFLNQCPNYNKKSVEQRKTFILEQKRCINCLSSKHSLKECQSSNCKNCGEKHHTSLHVDSQTLSTNTINDNQDNVILITALVMCNSIQLRAFLDCGSQPNLITRRMVKRLNLDMHHYTTPVLGASQTALKIRGCVNLTIRSRITNYTMTMTALVVDKFIGILPAEPINRKKYNIPNHLQLADPNFDRPSRIDLLIGQEYFFEILLQPKIKLGDGLHSLYLHNSEFGWLLGGRQDSSKGHPGRVNCIEINKSLERFWSIEEINTKRQLTPEENLCEKHFNDTHRRDPEGRYVVQLFLNSNPNITLGDSKATATRRLLQLEKRLQAEPELRRQYNEFIDEYLTLKHMRLVPDDDKHCYYLPHHYVLRPESKTTKLRVVFDASAKTSSGNSLNDILHVGPTIQEDLLSLVLRFRRFRYVLNGDITKMYRQILIDAEQTHLQRILWRRDPTMTIQSYELLTVTYGTSSAPYLATKTLQQLALDYKTKYPLASPIVLRDFYMDDLLTGTDDLQTAVKLRDEIRLLLQEGRCEIRKWASNCPHLINDLPESERAYKFPFNSEESLKPLGLEWHPKDDTFRYTIQTPTITSVVTKRLILSSIARIFDPLGLLGPVILIPKIIMQQLWKLGLDWDASVPTDIETKWAKYLKELPSIQQKAIPRLITIRSNYNHIALHGYCDASEQAYGACVYAVTSHDGETSSHLICAKSRISPVKPISIPRLELCGAVLLSKLMHKVKQALNIYTNIHLFTDSTIVLCWIKTDRPWKTFISNRVSEIHQLSNSSEWRHIPGATNPADVLSRGCTSLELLTNDLWWHGPCWAKEAMDRWPTEMNNEVPMELITKEEKFCQLIRIETAPSFVLNLISSISSAHKLIRIFAYLKRYNYNTSCKRTQSPRMGGSLTIFEVTEAERTLVLICQRNHFGFEQRSLKENREVSSSSRLLQLHPFIDSNGLIRVGGRLRHATLSANRKHPIVLPAKDPLTSLIIMREHLRQLHSGTQLTLARVRQQYWPLLGRQTVRNVLKRCLTCFKASPVAIAPLMGDLPSYRVNPARAFDHCGVDFAGPFLLRHGGPRSKIQTKAYASVFICMATKAIHIELVSSLTTEAFLNTLHRFIARRGMISHLYSDNATNFVGTKNEIQRLLNDKIIQQEYHELKIHWHMIPPRSPHFGGLWEAAVKSMKKHLVRVTGNTVLTFEELATLLAQIEAVLNSRPLTPLSNDPNDLECLTPGHFLMGTAPTSLPQEKLENVSVNRLSRWQHINLIQQHFWKRWKQEYLHTLQSRSKWQHHRELLKIGDMVLVKNDLLPPLQWCLGRVKEIHPGQDGIVRTVTLTTAKGEYKRAVANLCPLPGDNL